MKKLFADKLQSGKVIVRDGKGWARVLTPPCGVSYDPVSRSWKVHVPNIYGDWTTASFYDSEYGPFVGFKRAIEEREKKLHCLLSTRLLPRIRREYVLVSRGGRWAVRDPFTQQYVTFSSRAMAAAYNQDLIDEFIEKHTLSRDRMITVATFG